MGHSDRKAEELVHKADFAYHVTLCQAAIAAADHPHHLEAFDGGGGCCHPLEAAGRPDHALERAIARLDDIIEVFRRPMLDVVRQQAFRLQALICLGIRRQFVSREDGG
jgi:hypothetical protein